MDELAKVKPDTMRFDALMLNVRDGKIRVPDFQREFVWELSQIISLLDSIYQHFPIGSFLFWETDDEIQAYRRIGEVELRHDTAKGIQYVLDGQQRLTTISLLYAALHKWLLDRQGEIDEDDLDDIKRIKRRLVSKKSRLRVSPS